MNHRHPLASDSYAEPFREPDAGTLDAEGKYIRAIWYGPGKKSRADCATEVEKDCCGCWIVTEYTNAVGLIDNPERKYLVRSLTLDPEEATTAQEAASVGCNAMAHTGGDSDGWASYLPTC